MDLFKSIALLLAIILTSSCGRDASGDVDNERRLKSKEELFEELSISSVICGERYGNCPNNIVKLTYWYEDSGAYFLGVCSGTLIDEEHVLTNRHCIPKNIQFNGAECNYQMIAQFPETKTGKKEKKTCQSVVQVFLDSEDYPDLAVIKIEKAPGRLQAPILKNGLRHGKRVHAYTMDPSPFRSTRGLGTIRKKKCRVSLDNMVFMKQTNTAGTFLVSGGSCDVISGNSGSGLFDRQGNLIGVLHKRMIKRNLRKHFAKFDIPHNNFTHMGVAVNMGCLKSLKYPSAPNCQVRPMGHGDINAYLDEKTRDFNLENVDEKLIRLTLLGNLEVKMEKDSYIFTSESFYELRQKISSLYNDTFKTVWSRVFQ